MLVRNEELCCLEIVCLIYNHARVCVCVCVCVWQHWYRQHVVKPVGNTETSVDTGIAVDKTSKSKAASGSTRPTSGRRPPPHAQLQSSTLTSRSRPTSASTNTTGTTSGTKGTDKFMLNRTAPSSGVVSEADAMRAARQERFAQTKTVTTVPGPATGQRAEAKGSSRSSSGSTNVSQQQKGNGKPTASKNEAKSGAEEAKADAKSTASTTTTVVSENKTDGADNSGNRTAETKSAAVDDNGDHAGADEAVKKSSASVPVAPPPEAAVTSDGEAGTGAFELSASPVPADVTSGQSVSASQPVSLASQPKQQQSTSQAGNAAAAAAAAVMSEPRQEAAVEFTSAFNVLEESLPRPQYDVPAISWIELQYFLLSLVQLSTAQTKTLTHLLAMELWTSVRNHAWSNVVKKAVLDQEKQKEQHAKQQPPKQSALAMHRAKASQARALRK
jgi:hypothetical protein